MIKWATVKEKLACLPSTEVEWSESGNQEKEKKWDSLRAFVLTVVWYTEMPSQEKICGNNMRSLEKTLRRNKQKDCLWLMQGRAEICQRKKSMKQNPKCWFYRVSFWWTPVSSSGGNDTNSGAVEEFALQRQLLLILMWKSISCIRGRVQEIKHKEFTIFVSIYICFIHIYAWKWSEKM